MSSVPTNAQLEDTLRKNAAAPAEASNETGTFKQHSLKDQIELDKHLGRKSVSTNPRKALGFTKILPGGEG